MSELKKFNYTTFQDEPLSGTDDWQKVAYLEDPKCDYEWAEFRAFYSPSARRYFWHGDSGCSCNGWGDDVSTAASFENGGRADLLRAWENFTKDHGYYFGVGEYLSGVAEIRKFKAA